MADIIKVYKEEAPPSRFIGIRYGEDRRIGRSYAHLWNNWFEQRRFEELERLMDEGWAQIFPEAGSYIGLMRSSYGQAFEYWIGMFLPPGTVAPAGFDSLDAPGMTLQVCWVQGKEPEIFAQVDPALALLRGQGTPPIEDRRGYLWVMERYQCPRFTQPDEAGVRILDLAVMTGMEPGMDPKARAQDGPVVEADLEGRQFCSHCFRAFEGKVCPDCGRKGAQLRLDDPIYIGELPGRLRNALQIGFGATEIPFNALSNLGSGYTLAAGDLFESYRIYVPYERAEEAKAAFQRVLDINEPED